MHKVPDGKYHGYATAYTIDIQLFGILDVTLLLLPLSKFTYYYY
jgi:hypothetical protein